MGATIVENEIEAQKGVTVGRGGAFQMFVPAEYELDT
jgi:hypothetical protein